MYFIKKSFVLMFMLIALMGFGQELVTFTSEQDHQNMMDQIGVTSVRPGPSGNESAPNHANYDRSIANPYLELPALLTLNNGKKVKNASEWWEKRRPEIVEDMEREIYGRIPENVPSVTWEVEIFEREFMGRTPVIAKLLKGHVDNSSYPQISVDIEMVVVTPANAEGPVPVLMMFGGPAFLLLINPMRTTWPNLMKHLGSYWPKTLKSRKHLINTLPTT